MSFKKFACIVLSIFVAGTAVLFSVMLHDTDSVIADFKKCVNGDAEGSTSPCLYERYHTEGTVRADVKIRRSMVMHNFNRGVMYVCYSCVWYDKNGEIIRGSMDIPAKWNIGKIDGKWVVSDISEAP